jgi:hypothetical protein
LVESELADLETQPDNVVEDDPSDSSNEDYQPIPRMPPWAHDREARGFSLAPPQSPQTGPAFLVILERMWQD